MNLQELEDIGLTPREIKIYLALLEEGPNSAGVIIKKTNVQNSVFHFCINNLIEKGLVSYTKKNKFRIYSAADPENIILYLKDKEKKIKSILPELKSKQFIVKEKQTTELFEGIKGVITLLNELIIATKKGDEFLFFTPETEESEEIQKFYDSYDIKRKDRGLLIKGIVPVKLKPLFEKRKILKIKYTKMPLPPNMGICNDKIGLISWEKTPSGFLLHSRHLAEKQRKFFHALWNTMD